LGSGGKARLVEGMRDFNVDNLDSGRETALATNRAFHFLGRVKAISEQKQNPLI
jgi:hypothetical protein